MADLSAAQANVAALVADGLLNKEIAHQLGITQGTVKSHVGEAIKRLGLRNRVQLAVWHVRRELERGARHAS